MTGQSADGSPAESDRTGSPLIDPRRGDVEDDAASPKQSSLLSIAGNLLVEISLPKLLFAWSVSLLLPAMLLGLAPLVATAWLATVSTHALQLTEIGAALVLLASVALAWWGWRPLWRMAEASFWSLNALVVQPGYVFAGETIRHAIELTFAGDGRARTRLRAASSGAAGVIVCGCAAAVIALVWPATRWLGSIGDLALFHRVILPTIANAVVLVSAYLAVAALAWGFADATMDQPSDIAAFDAEASDNRRWRVAHLSDLHVVGERYGFRIESGRGGPRGNERLHRVLARLAALDAADPLDLVLVTGDMTDAGRASEWAEFLDAIAPYPALASRMIVLPGNHDLNIVDRANPARLDLPFSPGKRLRQMRTLSAMASVQGDRVHVAGTDGKYRTTLNAALAAHRGKIAQFAESGGLRRSIALERTFHDQFPMFLLPRATDGLGVAILDSNVESHFSFTNALGFVSLEQAQGLVAAMERLPHARWIVAMHHHLLEYPMPVALSERVGTALVNGSWLVRKLRPFASRMIVMHGHRHIDWIGSCGPLQIVSAPSPVMGSTDGERTHFHVHTIVARPDGSISLLAPERVDIAGLQA